MNILDITELLMNGHDEYYVFNPSIVPILERPSWFLVSYRICWYDIPIQLPPWKAWEDKHRYFSNRNVLPQKCRAELGPSRCVPFQMLTIPKVSPEYDSTGLAIIKMTPCGLEIVSNNIAPFRYEMNQDARLTLMENGDIRISYNVFNAVRRCILLWRTLYIHFDEWMFEYTSEQEMFESKQEIEKNCVFFRDKIIYSVGAEINYLTSYGAMFALSCPMRQLPKTHISSSAAPIPWIQGKYLALGHLKVEYDSPLLDDFFSITNMSEIQRHSQYIYFIFFYELEANGRVTRVSPPFIPTHFMDHLPHLLTMPTGLCCSESVDTERREYIIAYGEGDCRCKLLFMHQNDINALLRNGWNGESFHYLCTKFTVNHIGYFNKANTGDECFRHVFSYLHHKYYPAASLEFLSSDVAQPETNLTIYGGGDIITPYFLGSCNVERALAIGVGIPYCNYEGELARFKHVILRDKSDAARLGIKYFPDLGFLLPRIFPSITASPIHRLIGISVMRTYYNPLYSESYVNYLDKMVEFITKLVEKNFKIILFPFGVNIKQPNENDMITCMEIRRLLNYNDNVTILKPCFGVEEVYSNVAKLEFMICARFHSHIFAAALGVPFISLTLGRKCIQFMRQASLLENLYRLKNNEVDLPVELDTDLMYSFFCTRYDQREIIKEKLRRLNYDYAAQMDTFEREYVRLVAENVKDEKICLYPSLDEEEEKMDLVYFSDDDEFDSDVVIPSNFCIEF